MVRGSHGNRVWVDVSERLPTTSTSRWHLSIHHPKDAKNACKGSHSQLPSRHAHCFHVQLAPTSTGGRPRIRLGPFQISRFLPAFPRLPFSAGRRANFGCCCFHARFVRPPIHFHFSWGSFCIWCQRSVSSRIRVWRRPARNEVTSSPRLLKNPKWRPVNPLAAQSRGHITRASGDPFVVRRRIAGHRAGPSSFFLVLQPLLVHSTSADLAIHGEL